MVEGLMMRLHPEFRMISVIGPYVSRSRRVMLSPKFIARQTERNLSLISKMLLQSPEKVKRLTTMLESGKLEFSVKYEGERRLVEDLRKDINRLTLSMFTLGFMVAAALVISAYKPEFFRVEHFLVLSGFIVVAFFGGLMLKIFREGA